jgi:hypothetical protein
VAELGAPASYLTLHKGDPVLSRQGVQVGTLHVVIADRAAARERRRQRPPAGRAARRGRAIHEGGVVLAVDTGACARLPEAAPA